MGSPTPTTRRSDERKSPGGTPSDPWRSARVWARGGESEQAERLRAATGRLSRLLRSTRAGSGLTPSQISVLFTIVRREEIPLSNLAEAEEMNPTMLSRIVAQLVAAGLIVRELGPVDRRIVTLAPTAAGRRLRERIHRERTERLGRHLELLGESDRRLLWEALPVLEQLAQLLSEGIE